ncbi:MAG TPA: type II toxin-antitoxin system mRNA interferase toxin, RelE/StbE family [Candidatus Paceibacterota bacterium]|nr:type II toxin-antitoxin system mRNA interferase toxin, RelE/StbE family [Candidatus Paceibacterota bacterium]HMO83067.1 type II toxin-antitoxin system mRNA interferase toxin, RelE/StbE family [Candidatus Paceibacterota bacterium]
MNVKFHKNFKKALKKQPGNIQNKFFECLDIFVEDQFSYQLNNHALSGKFKGWRSINITGDVRVHYREEERAIILLDIGTHAQLYK